MAKMTLEDLVAQTRAAFGEALRAVVLYGSAAAGEHVPKKSDINVLLIVDSFSPDRMAAASAGIKAWTDAGNPPPLTLTSDEWRTSADIFPMEYADILDRNRVLFGTLPADVVVDRTHLRLQLEREAMGTLLQLRRGALAAGNDGKLQVELLEASLSTIMVLFRAVVRLRDQQPPGDNLQLTQGVATAAGFDGSPLASVIRHKRGEVAIRAGEAAGVLTGCLAGIQQLVRYLDEFSTKQS